MIVEKKQVTQKHDARVAMRPAAGHRIRLDAIQLQRYQGGISGSFEV
jgi:hypothetical protein